MIVLEIILALFVVMAILVALALPVIQGVDEPEYDAQRAELEDAKQAKYREIRDAELDRASGRLTDEQWREIDAELRKEALAIVTKMDTLNGSSDRAQPSEASDAEIGR